MAIDGGMKQACVDYAQSVIVTRANNEQTMTSLQISEVTGKTHSNVMRDIRNLLEQLENKAQFSFELGSYQDANGQNRPCYILTKKDCLLLASGYDANLRAKIILRWEPLSFSKLLRNCFAVIAKGFRKFGVGVSQHPICLNTSIKRGYDILHRPRRHSENLRYARGIDIADVEKFGNHVPRIDNFSLTRFGENGIFRHVKFLGYGLDNVIGEFCNLRHNCGDVVRRMNKTARPAFKSYKSLQTHIALAS